MLILDIAIVNVALPSMQRTLSLSAENIQWVVSGYALTFGGFLMLGGRLADVVGRRRMFVTGLVLFIGASMLGGFSQSGGMLIAARLIQGFAGALVSPAALSLLTTTFKEGPERNRALGIWSAMAAGGASAGLILGGLLTQELSWRFTLFVNVPLGLAAVLLSPVLPADAPRREEKVNLDVPGAVSLTVGILAEPGRSGLVPTNGTDHGRFQHRGPYCHQAWRENPDRARNSCTGGGDAPVPENRPRKRLRHRPHSRDAGYGHRRRTYVRERHPGRDSWRPRSGSGDPFRSPPHGPA